MRSKPLKEKMTEVGIQLFERKGFSETSIQDICDTVGVTKGAFYYYFTSKEELLMDIHLSYINDMLMHQDVILTDVSKDSKAKLYEMVYMLLQSIEQNGASARVFFREMRHLSDERLTEIIPKRNQVRLNVERVLREGIEKGEFQTTLNVTIATFGILGIINWSYQWFNPTGEVPAREVAKVFVNMILQGIEI